MDKKVVRESYESCLSAAARLAAYATSKPFLEAVEVNDRQDLLATDDLVVFCIHARRLIKKAGIEDIVKKTTIKTCNGISLSFWKVLGCVIHYEELEISRSESRFAMMKAFIESKTEKEFWEKVTPEVTRRSFTDTIAPHILLKSDESERMFFSLYEFMKIFSEKIIRAVIEKALDEGFLLDNIFRDYTQAEVMQVLSRHDAIKKQKF